MSRDAEEWFVTTQHINLHRMKQVKVIKNVHTRGKIKRNYPFSRTRTTVKQIYTVVLMALIFLPSGPLSLSIISKMLLLEHVIELFS